MHFYPPDTAWEFRLGYRHTWNYPSKCDCANGFVSDAFMLGASHPLCWKTQAEIVYVHSLYDFGGRASPLGIEEVGGYSHSVTVQLSRPLNHWTELFLQYHLNRDDYERSVFDYKQHIVTLGIRADF